MRLIGSFLLMSALAALGPSVAPAQAQLSRTFVSAAIGNDANDCNRATPCRSFQGAHDKTNDQGEIMVLDPGGYGALRIAKSISVVNDGVGEASILVSGGVTGITVDAGASGSVNLRGITIQGIGFGGGTGLVFNSGFALTVTNCVIRGHTGSGILFAPNADGRLAVSNTLMADNVGNGIAAIPGGHGFVRVALSRVEAYDNSQHGFFFDGEFSLGNLVAVVADSVAAGNLRDGVHANSGSSSAQPLVMVTRSVLANNGGTGAAATGNALLDLSASTVSGNGTDVSHIQSFGDNIINFNFNSGPIDAVFPRR